MRALLSLLLLAAGFVVVPAAVVVATATPAAANVSAPSWWNGKTCDTDNYPGSYPLGASYNGVIACGPGPYNQGGTDHSVHFFSGAWGEYEWECVELVMRYMYQVYGINPYSAPGGKDVVDNYSGSVLTKVTNDGTSTNVKVPSPGDIISVGAAPVNPSTGKSPNPSGHTAVVTGVNVTNGAGSITVMQQNASADGSGTWAVSGGKVTGTVLGGGVTGWLHNPSAGSSTPPPDTDGDGVPDSQDVSPHIPGPVNNRGIPNFTDQVSSDFNGDGKADIGVFYENGTDVQLDEFLGTATGFSSPTTVWDAGAGNWAWNQIKPVVGDFNGDGKADIGVFYDYGTSVGVLEFLGTATGFSSPTTVWSSSVGAWVWSQVLPQSGDFNGDGKADIGVFYDYGSGETGLLEFTGTSTGLSTPASVWDSGPNNWVWSQIKPVSGDFNGDGKADIGVFYDYGSGGVGLIEFLGTSTGFATPSNVWSSGAGNWAWNQVLQVSGDFNGDGKADIGVFYDYGTDVELIEFDGTSTGFTSPTTVWDAGAGNWAWNQIKPVSGDFNGDGKADIGVFYDYGSGGVGLIEFLGTSTGFGSPTNVWGSGPGNWVWSQVLVA